MGAETKIYVIGTARGPKKVGLSKMPSRRCLALDNAGIRGLSVLYERRIALSLARQIEGHAHHLLRHALVHGEWFKATIAQAREAIDAAVACDGDGEQAKRNVGRDKQWEKRLTLPLTSEMVNRLDAAKRPGEDRLTVIRKGIERELKSRERQAQKDRADG